LRWRDFSSLVGLPNSERAFVGVEREISAAASPTKRNEQSPIFELEYASNYYRSSSIFYCDYFRMPARLNTVRTGKRLLKPEKYKDIIISSLQFLVENNRVKVNAFVIRDNHIHLIWQMMAGIKPEAVQRDFMKFTAQKIKQDLIKNHPAVLAHFKVNAKDREYQFWERNALSVELNTLEMLKQKLEYIHYNPVIAGICNLPEEYKYSTAHLARGCRS